ncbi:unnamed protein product [Caenorhabditis bovis]|uniref:F-box domain-containing protein n=1 Tax=Caenorhabditis bovis TaxID=2654633 RepID=A0A8S1EBZ0_9PELO|nr:unnamed protein product [Caenorhabditis bovis]
MWSDDVNMEDDEPLQMTPEQEAEEDMCQDQSSSNYDSELSNNAQDKLSRKLDLQHDLTASPSRPTNPDVEHWIELFRSIPQRDQIEALTRLIQETSMDNIRHLKHLIEPHFQRDFLSCLPLELGVKILTNMAGSDIIKLAGVSHNWKMITELDLIWRRLCDTSLLNLPPPTNRVEGAWENTAISATVDIPDHMSTADFQQYRTFKMMHKQGPIFERAPDKAKYMRSVRIARNWRENSIHGSCILRGHEDHVITCMQIHDDLLVTGSDDNTLKVWSIDRGVCLFTLTGHTGGVWTSQISSCGRFIVSGSTDRSVKVWSTADGSLLNTLQGHTSTVRCMAICGVTLVTGSRDTTLRIWDAEKGHCHGVLVGHQAAVRCVQFDGHVVVSGGYDFTVKVWSARTGLCMKTLIGHANRIYSLLYDREKGIVASGSLDTTIRVWDLRRQDGEECIAVLQGHTSLTSGMQLKGHFLVSCNADSHVRVWDMRDGKCVFHLNGHRSAITSLQFFGEDTIVTSSDDGTVKLWDIKKGVHIRDLVKLSSGGSGGCIWRMCSTPTLLACAVGSRNNTEETKVILLDFDSVYP